MQDTLSQSQDKAFQRIAELREQIQLDHMAKVDVENNYRMLLEDKDELVKVLKTQVVGVVQEACGASSSSSQVFLGWPKQQRHHEDHYMYSVSVQHIIMCLEKSMPANSTVFCTFIVL